MSDEGTITIRDRKLFYDTYNHGYFFESKIEALERTTASTYKKADALNKNLKLQHGAAERLIGQREHIYKAKSSREIEEVRDSLREHVAYRKALNQIAKEFDTNPTNNGQFGVYGPNGNQTDASPLIEAELKQMNGETKRRKDTKRLLKNRKKPEVMDRSLPDEQIMKPRGRKRSKSETRLDAEASFGGFTENGLSNDKKTADFKKRTVQVSKDSVRKGSTSDQDMKLVLPPIQPSSGGPTKSKSNSSERDSESLHLPSVFVTQQGSRPLVVDDGFVLDTVKEHNVGN